MTKEHSLKTIREQSALAETYVGDGAYITAASVLRRLADQLQAKGEAAAAELAQHMRSPGPKPATVTVDGEAVPFDQLRPAMTKARKRSAARRNPEAQAAYDREWGTDNGFASWDDQRSAGEY